MIKRIIKAFYPDICPVCGKIMERVDVCDECKKYVKVIKGAGCIKCGRAIDRNKLICRDCKNINHFFEENISIFEYNDWMAKCIYQYKYQNARLYADYFVAETVKNYKYRIKSWNADVIVAVPIYYKKKIRRGYNQAEEFARRLAKALNIKYDADYIIRRKSTVPQKELTSQMRRENLQDAFAVNKNKIGKYRRVIIADDVYTTGSTIDSCANIMKRAGVENIYGVCITTKAEKSI